MKQQRPTPMDQPQAATRRAGARRTAWLLAAIAVTVYAGFIAMGVLGR